MAFSNLVRTNKKNIMTKINLNNITDFKVKTLKFTKSSKYILVII